MILEHDLRRRNCVLNQLNYWVTPDGLTVVLPAPASLEDWKERRVPRIRTDLHYARLHSTN